MHMGINRIGDRLVGDRSDRGERLLRLRDTASRIDHRHSIIAHHEADIGDVSAIGDACLGDLTLMDENARCDLAVEACNPVRCQRDCRIVPKYKG